MTGMGPLVSFNGITSLVTRSYTLIKMFLVLGHMMSLLLILHQCGAKFESCSTFLAFSSAKKTSFPAKKKLSDLLKSTSFK